MPKYLTQQLANVFGPQFAPLEPLAGGNIAKRSRLPGVPRGQDKNVALGRRILLRQSLQGANAWHVPDTNPTKFGGSRTHPAPDVARPVAFAFADVTPGHVLSLSVLYAPSGETQIASGPDWVSGGKGGRVRVVIEWTAQDATTITTTHDLALDVSGEEFGAAPSNPWAAVRRGRIPLMTPGAVNTPELAARWSAHTNVKITMYYIGGVRMIDATVEEVPYWVGREESDDPDLWTSHLFGGGSPDGPPNIGTDYAFASTAAQLANTAKAQGLRLGPQLISWSAWNETTAPLDDTIASVSFSSSSFVRLDGAATTYSADEPGWSIGTAAYATDAGECDPYYGLRSVPVLVAVYASTGSTTTGRVRVQASPWSWVDVDVAAGTSPGWHLSYGHLSVRDPSVVQAFVRRTSGTGAVNVAAISIYRMGQYTPAGT